MPRFLLHPAAPLLFGTIGVLALLSLLLESSAAPADLAVAHARVPGLHSLDGCEQCHSDDGMSAGCLGCHVEIGAQLEGERGYHGHMARSGELECARCHSEHHGNAFALVNPMSWGAQVEAAFQHPHVEFTLMGAHDLLPCEDCHRLADRPTLPGFERSPRKRTRLGLDQQCVTCHVDEHSDGLSGSCLECHDQHDFETPHFDHGLHLSLEGGHDGLACEGCHVLPPAGTPRHPLPFPFESTVGTACRDCHDDPHRAAWETDCTSCHAPDHGHFLVGRESITPELHARTGFTLSAPHQEVACDGCHPSDLSFAERHPDPHDPNTRRVADGCERCHDDAHDGQFAGRYERCADCHLPEWFAPTAFDHDQHRRVFDLSGAHSAVACIACHERPAADGVRIFVGTKSECRECHEDPHAGQFDEKIARADCDQCHLPNADRFTVGVFDHLSRTGFALIGAHARADCGACHREADFVLAGAPVRARRFTGTPKACADCHVDVHRGQFADYESCDVCHTSQDRWERLTFDHTTQSRFPLEGAHARAECSACHKPETLPDGFRVVRYEPIPHRCGDCHDILPSPGQ